jgi:hypothetical protein
MRGRAAFLPGGIRRSRLMRGGRRGQIIVLALVIILLFILAAAVLVDVYMLEEARNWGYRAAQQAALAGAARGRDWNYFQPTVDPMVPTATPSDPPCADPGRIRLTAGDAVDAADDMLAAEMGARGFTTRTAAPSSSPGTYYADVEVLPDPNGGSTPGFPPEPVRLGSGRGFWSADNPAVGVYLTFPVYTFFMSFVGRDSVTVHVFAAAEAAQPAVCPP